MDIEINTRVGPVISGSEKKHGSNATLKYFYKKQKFSNIISENSISGKINFYLFGHLIYTTGVICGLLGIIIGFLKKNIFKIS